jgi:hypothetical protein
MQPPVEGVDNRVSVADERTVVTPLHTRDGLRTARLGFYESAERMKDPGIWLGQSETSLAGPVRSAGCADVATESLPHVTDDSTPLPETGRVTKQPVSPCHDHGPTDRIWRRPIRNTGRYPPSKGEGPAVAQVRCRIEYAARVLCNGSLRPARSSANRCGFRCGCSHRTVILQLSTPCSNCCGSNGRPPSRYGRSVTCGGSTTSGNTVSQPASSD